MAVGELFFKADIFCGLDPYFYYTIRRDQNSLASVLDTISFISSLRTCTLCFERIIYLQVYWQVVGVRSGFFYICSILATYPFGCFPAFSFLFLVCWINTCVRSLFFCLSSNSCSNRLKAICPFLLSFLGPDSELFCNVLCHFLHSIGFIIHVPLHFEMNRVLLFFVTNNSGHSKLFHMNTRLFGLLYRFFGCNVYVKLINDFWVLLPFFCSLGPSSDYQINTVDRNCVPDSNLDYY